MERERAAKAPLLLLDTGGAFLKKLEDAANAPLTELTARTMVDGLGKMGYDALNLGRADLLLPPALLRSLAAGAPFPVLSANIVDPAGKQPFKSWVVKEVGGLRVGIFGVSGNQPQPVPPLPGRDLTVRDPFVAARASIAELRQRADLVIALSQLGLDDDVRLAREAPGIDIVLGGSSRQSTPVPRIEGSTMILHSGAKGMSLGRLDLRIVPGAAGPWTAAAAAGGGTRRVFEWKLVPLNTTLPDHPALSDLLGRYRGELNARNLVEQTAVPPPPPPPVGPAYVGFSACGVCHPEQLRQWGASKHARALSTLTAKKQDANPECVRCHVTAYGETGGYRIGQAAAPSMSNVQCEACHGFGRDHRGRGRIRGKVPEVICRRCHTGENSPEFSYEKYLRMLGEHTARYFTRSRVPASPGRPR